MPQMIPTLVQLQNASAAIVVVGTVAGLLMGLFTALERCEVSGTVDDAADDIGRNALEALDGPAFEAVLATEG